ncbi:MnhB domain-containing protein [Alkaliphilus transvaalensis]|uniref:MnhB domain-containing protein n=1 Tax=Alkaliphilus transvaalensis TaxID=114628 RepID=UPI000556408B|nr:MnhB domain-containing protein [Alkaliphilus transvaalensis]
MDDLIVKTITRLIVPFIQLYGIFIILHGHISPGGGFSGGAILGSSIILFTLSYGLERASKKVPHKISAILESAGILWYIFIGLIGIALGGTFLANQDSGFFMGEAGRILSAGMIPLLTVAIGIKVASTMVTLFHTIIEED